MILRQNNKYSIAICPRILGVPRKSQISLKSVLDADLVEAVHSWSGSSLTSGAEAYPLKILTFRLSEMQFCEFLESDLRKNESKVTVKI